MTMGGRIVWSYGITTVPSRKASTFPVTVMSLAKAGFDAPKLFVDGSGDPTAYGGFGNSGITCRERSLGAFGNWITSLSELYYAVPNADRFALFQDDFVTYPNLRKYLDRIILKDEAYLNLYTFPENEQYAPVGGFQGFYLSNSKGKGAVALVFGNWMTQQILNSPEVTDHAHNPSKGNRGIDNCLAKIAQRRRWHEYVHMPSLVQHIGHKSTIGHHEYPQSNSFRGEDFNASKLLDRGP